MRALLATASVVALVFAFCDGARGLFTSATATRAGPTAYNALPAAPVYGDSRTGFVQVASYEATVGASPGSFAWPEAALLGAAGAILGVALRREANARWSGPAAAAVTEPDLEAAAAAARVALLAVDGADAGATPLSRRDALAAASAAVAASLPFAANAEEDAMAEAAPPPPPPKPKQYGAFGAPIRKADQSKIGVSSVNVPTEGKGSPGAGLGSVKIDASGYKKCTEGTSVIGPNGCAGNFSSSRGFLDLGETKPKSDYKEDKKYLDKKAKDLAS